MIFNYWICWNRASSCSASATRALTEAGFYSELGKSYGSGDAIVLFGLIVDSANNCIEVPVEKLQALKQMAFSHASKNKLTKKELETIVGHFSFASRAIHGARTFSRIFIDKLCRLSWPSHHVCVSRLLRNELLWCYNFAADMNSLCYCELGKAWPVKTICTDASFFGFGAVVREIWMTGTWNRHKEPIESFSQNWLLPLDIDASLQNIINFLELVAACARFWCWDLCFVVKNCDFVWQYPNGCFYQPGYD